MLAAKIVSLCCAICVSGGTAQSTEKDNALHQAIVKGDVEEVRRLIANGANVEARSDQGQTPLHLAAQRGNAQMAALLIKDGARVDSRSIGMQNGLS